MTRTKKILSGIGAALLWPVRTANRLVMFGWFVGCMFVGSAANAAADDDFIKGPDLAGGAAQTVFERFPTSAWTLPPLNLSDAHHGAPYIEEGLWNFLHFMGNGIIWISMTFVKGAITAMQWMLELSIYRDNASQIDSNVQSLATAVFWPLFGTTIAVAATTLYVNAKRIGKGAVLGDAIWMVVAGVLAVTFAIAPSKVADDIDGATTLLADGVMTGYSSGGAAGANAAGFPDVAVQAGPTGAVRKLSDAMWNVYAVTPWCVASFGTDLSVCKDVGHEFIENTDRWKAIDASTHERGENDDPAPPCADELKGNCDWVRGQSAAQFGAVIFMALMSIPLALLLLGLVVFGIMAKIGFVLLLLIGLVFLVLWMIPGRPRAAGVRWFEALIGSGLQVVIITALIGGVMVLSGIFNAMIGTYGFWVVGLLNLAAFVVVLKIRAMFENMTGMASPGSTAGISSYAAMKLLGAAGRGAKGITQAGAKTGLAAGKGALAGTQAAFNQAYNPNSGLRKGMGAAAGAARGARGAFRIPTPASQPAGGRKVVQPTALPAGASAGRTAIGPMGTTPGSTPMAPPVPAAVGAGASGPRALPAAPSNATSVVGGGSGSAGQKPRTFEAGSTRHGAFIAGKGGTTPRPGAAPSAPSRPASSTRAPHTTPPVAPRPAPGIGSGVNAYRVRRPALPPVSRRSESPVSRNPRPATPRSQGAPVATTAAGQYQYKPRSTPLPSAPVSTPRERWVPKPAPRRDGK